MNNKSFSNIRTIKNTISENISKSMDSDFEKARRYNVGDISEKTGLQKQADGSWKPAKNNKSNWAKEEKKIAKELKHGQKTPLGKFQGLNKMTGKLEFKEDDGSKRSVTADQFRDTLNSIMNTHNRYSS